MAIDLNITGEFKSNGVAVGGNINGVHAITRPYSGQYIGLNATAASNSSTVNIGANTLVFYPFIPSNNLTINQISIEVVTASATSFTFLTLYSDLNGKPNSRFFQSTSIDTATTGQKIITTSQSFVAGTTYWIGVCTSSGTVSLRAIAFASTFAISNFNSTGIIAQNHWTYSIPVTPGFEPATLSVGNIAGNINLIATINFRVA